MRLGKMLALPMVRPRKTSWQEGTATIWMAQSLSIENLVSRAGRQVTGLAPKDVGRFPGEQFLFQMFSPDAAVEVVMTRAPQRLEVSQATTLTLNPTELRGRTTADVQCLEGECFDLFAEIGVPWAVDALETEPADALGDWELTRPTDKRAAQLVHLRLAKPLRAGDSIRLSASGRHLSSAGAERAPLLRSDDLQMLTVRDAGTVARLWNIEAASGATVRLGQSAGVRELSVSELSEGQQNLFDRPPQGLLLVGEIAAPQIEVVSRPSPTSFGVKFDVQVVVTAQGLHEEYLVQCSPGGASVSVVEIRLSHARLAELQWTLQSSTSTRPLNRPEFVASSEGELWRVRLPFAMSTPFVLRALRDTPFADVLAVSLPMAPQADHQEGVLTVQGEPGVGFAIDNRRLEADARATGAAKALTAASVWRFKPDRDAVPQPPAISVLRQTAIPYAASAIIRGARLDSYYQQAGSARHRATFALHNEGNSSLQLVLPAEARQIALRVDGKPDVAPADAMMSLRVGLDRGTHAVEVEYTTPFDGLGTLTHIETQLPHWQAEGTELPVQDYTWTILSPAGFEVASAPAWQIEAPFESSWVQRLFGVLA
jgi:hypothetical protein